MTSLKQQGKKQLLSIIVQSFAPLLRPWISGNTTKSALATTGTASSWWSRWSQPHRRRPENVLREIGAAILAVACIASGFGANDVTTDSSVLVGVGNAAVLRTRDVAVLVAATPPPNPNVTVDRHPELKSRTVAWTEFDGSYLVDTSSRAEMLDFFWNVFDRFYPDHGWTGSVNPPVAGGTSELWRVREYAQLNAYRALNGSPAVSEDPTKLDYVQSAALVFALNPDRGLSHVIDSTWVGYNATAADAARMSLLNGNGSGPVSLAGAADIFIADADSGNAAAVGHRMYLLHDNSTSAALGSSVTATISGINVYANVWYPPITADATASLEQFVAYPSPEYFPIGMLNSLVRWSFVPANDWTEFAAATDGVQAKFTYYPGLSPIDTTVTAKINGVDTPVNNLVRNNPPGPLTWDFGSALDFEGGKVADGTTVEITIHNVGIFVPRTFHVTGYRDYHYTVTLFDENKITPSFYSALTPLVNISTRAVIGTNDAQMIAGFTVAGTTPVRVALRTQGPGLAAAGIQNPAKSTHIRVYDQATQTLMGENTGWKTHPSWRMLQSLGVAPTQDSEAGMVLTLWPGSYTAIVSDDTGSNGIGIVEAFNIDNLSQAQLVNLSTRGLVGNGDSQMIAGITVQGKAQTIVIRTQGPGLAQFGVSNPVSDTVLTVVNQNTGQTIAVNDDWQTDPRNARLKTDLSALAPSDPREAALVLTLQPGAYTALVSAKGSPGIGIVEAFDVGN